MLFRSAQAGERLIAEASEGNRTRRTGMYEVVVRSDSGETVCHFRGRTYGVGGSVIEGPDGSRK